MNEDARRSGAEPAQGAALELRVLSGVHAGARIELPALGPDNETTLSIGPGLDHDIVLSDAPGSAQLRGSRGLWTWEEQSFHEGLNSSGGWRWGPLTFSLGPPDARWALPERLLFDRSAPVAGEQSAGSARPSDDAQNSVSPADDAGLSRLAGPPSPDPGTISEATTPDATVTAPTQPPGTHGRRAAWAIVGMMLLIAALVLLMRSSPERTETVERPTPIVPTSVSPQQIDTAALKAALTQAGLAERVRLSPTADGRIRLSGVVADDDELDRAIAAVRPITRRIVQGILTQNEFKARVAAVQAEVPQAVRLQAEPVGRVRVLDWDRPGVDLNALRSWLAQALPETLAIDTPAPAPIAKRPEIVARSAPAPTPVAVAAIPILPAPPPDEPALPALPDIRLVIGGSNPYVVLGSGEKWLPGGQVGGWLLTAIEAQALVLEDRLGRQLRSPR